MMSHVNVVTEREEAKIHFKWTINNFVDCDQTPGGRLSSPEFFGNKNSASGEKIIWCLDVYPHGNKNSHREYVSVFLRLVDPEEASIHAKFTIAVLDKNDQPAFLRKLEHTFCENEIDWGFGQCLAREQILDSSKGFLPRGNFTIRCDLTYYGSWITKTLSEIPVPECTALDNLGTVYMDQKHVDITIKVGSNSIGAHKVVLAAQSPVFAAMFEHETKEKAKNTIEINDIQFEVVEEMLNFIYSGKSPKLSIMPFDLLAAAEKYHLDRLKAMSEREIASKLNPSTAVDALILSDLHSAKNLKEAVTKYITSKISELTSSDEWNKLHRHPHLLTELVNRFAGVRK